MTKARKIGKVSLRVLGFLLILVAFDQAFSPLESRTKGNSPTADLLFGVLILGFTSGDKDKEKRG